MKPVLHSWPLAHHAQSEQERCLLIPLAGRRVAICARCTALYPTLIAALVVQGLVGAPPHGRLDWLFLALQLPMLMDWGAARLRMRAGSNASRLLTGAIGGLGLGRSFWLYFREPGSELFWVNLAALCIVAVAVEVTRGFRLRG